MNSFLDSIIKRDPAAGSKLNVILNYHKFNRSKIVNVPMWTSSCLLHALTSITNVTVKNYKANCIIAVHKWGNTYKYKRYTYSDNH